MNPKKVIFIGVGTLAGVIAVIVVAKQVVKLIRGREGKKGVNAAKSEIKGSDLSFSNATYQQMADTLYSAMKGSGTDYNAIERTLKRLKTKSDWNKLVVTFGVKKISHWYYEFEGNLVEWLNDELGEGEQDNINEILSKIGAAI